VAVVMGALSIRLSAWLVMRFGPRTVLVTGQLMIAAGLTLLALGPMNSDYLRNLLLPIVMLGVGAGLSFPSVSIVAMSGATPSDSGLASGLINTTTQVGGALGRALLAT